MSPPFFRILIIYLMGIFFAVNRNNLDRLLLIKA